MLDDAEHANGDEEHRHDRGEKRRDPGRATALGKEQQDEDDDRRGEHKRRQLRVDLLEAFERREHGDRRGNDGVAGKQRSARDADQEHHHCALAERDLRQRGERQNAALALVVGEHQEQHVLGGDDDEQRPDDQRYDADDLRRADPLAGELPERRLQRV